MSLKLNAHLLLQWWKQYKSTVKLTVTDSYEEIIIDASVRRKPAVNAKMEWE